jgi:hypothetical protein
LGQNNNLLLWCSDVTDYEGAGLLADPTLVHVKHFLVRNMRIIRSVRKPEEHAGLGLDVLTLPLAAAADTRPDLYM